MLNTEIDYKKDLIEMIHVVDAKDLGLLKALHNGLVESHCDYILNYFKSEKIF